MKRKAEKGKSWFQATLVLLVMYAHETTGRKDFKPADHLSSIFVRLWSTRLLCPWNFFQARKRE